MNPITRIQYHRTEPQVHQQSSFANRRHDMASPVGGIPMTVGKLDTCAVASAICGFTAFIPVLSQVAGIILGIVGLARIRRLRSEGHLIGGVGWAWAGILSSGFLLLSWIAVVMMLAIVGGVICGAADALPNINPVVN